MMTASIAFTASPELVTEVASYKFNISYDDLVSELVRLHCHVSLDNLGHCLVFALITLTGVIGNVALLLAILLNKHLLSIPNIFIVNLTIADLLYILTTAPFNIRHELVACWLLGDIACKIKHYVPLVTQGACVFSLVALSHERYTVIVRGLEARTKKSSQRTFLIIGTCWFAGVLIGIPVLIISETNTYGLLCSYMPIQDAFTWPKGYIICIFLLLYVFPFLTITRNYVEISRTLCKESMVHLAENNRAAIKAMQGRRRLALIVIIITLFFGLMWFPYHVYHIWYMFTKNHSNIRYNKSHIQFFRHFYNYASLANSCFNPWVVFLMSSAHRGPLMKCFRKLPIVDAQASEISFNSSRRMRSIPSDDYHAGHTSVSKV